MKRSLSRVAVLTGGSSGIGRCAASRLARDGWRIGLIARGAAGLADAASDCVGAVATAAADVTDEVALEAAAGDIEAALGPIDLWVNCAGNGTYGRFLDTPSQAFRRVTEVTYLGAVNGARVALRRMVPRDTGCVVNVCSAVAFHGMPLLASYSGAKHALRGFDQALRAELAQAGSRVRVTTIFPPAVNTPFFDHALSFMGRPGRPMAPVYQPEIVAEAIRLAASSGGGEMAVSSIAVLFKWSARFFPRVVERAIRLLGDGGQLSDCPEAAARYRPTLAAPAAGPSPARGGHAARSRSAHVWWVGVRARVAGWL